MNLINSILDPKTVTYLLTYLHKTVYLSIVN